MKVYEEMLANMKAEVARLQANEDRLGGHVESLEAQMTQTSTQITRLEAQVQEKEGRLAIAQKVRVSLESQRKDWLDQLDNLKTESSTLEEQETVTVAASMYLAQLPQWQRTEGLRVIQDAIDSKVDFGGLANIFYPGNMDNILATCDLPGWRERLLQKLAVVYDPHNIAQEIFKHSTPDRLKLHYIECIQDLEPVYATITSAAAAANTDNARFVQEESFNSFQVLCSGVTKSVTNFLTLSQ